ncbi:hypothetical protein EV11_0490 [Prochlorococcus sp. SS52]|nr:hypothetical protein EV08_0511 [Prochlorococcus marinus str. SS2]KGG33940.1 hypothetical protein EV10_0379 [Prochlorococcus marinus str. SS51]KGG36710.1 hypothetical protein EV11_0490 [Prochlorococcus sp. SS52]
MLKAMRKILSLGFVFFLSSAPVIAWGWGENSPCPYSKKDAIQEEVSNEESDKSKSSDKK